MTATRHPASTQAVTWTTAPRSLCEPVGLVSSRLTQSRATPAQAARAGASPGGARPPPRLSPVSAKLGAGGSVGRRPIRLIDVDLSFLRNADRGNRPDTG